MSDRDTVTFGETTLLIAHIVGWAYDTTADATRIYTTLPGASLVVDGDKRAILLDAFSQGSVRVDRWVP